MMQRHIFKFIVIINQTVTFAVEQNLNTTRVVLKMAEPSMGPEHVSE